MARTMYKLLVLGLALNAVSAALGLFGTFPVLLEQLIYGVSSIRVIGTGFSALGWFLIALAVLYFIPLLLKRYVPEVKEA